MSERLDIQTERSRLHIKEFADGGVRLQIDRERVVLDAEQRREVARFLRVGPSPYVDCPDHRPVQHRDGKPRWCSMCGLDIGGHVPKSVFDKKRDGS